MLDSLALFIVSNGNIVNNCTSCYMEHQHILRFLFVNGLTTIHLVGGLGVEDQQNDLIGNQSLLHVTSFCEDGKVYPPKQTALDKMEQQIRDTSATILNFLGRKRQVCIFHYVQDLE
jgi:hypothetical protein